LLLYAISLILAEGIKIMKTFIGIIVFVMFLIFVSISFAATYYISPSGSNSASGTVEAQPWRSFSYAFGRMSAGDELILLDGTYSEAAATGYINWNDGSAPNSAQPPSGTGLSSSTVVRAKNPGSVLVDGAGRDGLLLGRSSRKDSYIKIRGIRFEGGGQLYNTSYITIKECGFHSEQQSGSSVFGIGTNDHNNGNIYNLIEDCWVWGKERVIAINYRSSYNVWRRVVIRGDGCGSASCTGSGNPNVGFTVYGSSNNSIQNLIVVDRILGGGTNYADFATAEPTRENLLGPNEWLGCLSLHSEDGGFYFEGQNISDYTHTLRNIVAWDSGRANVNIGTALNLTLENVTAGISGAGLDGIRVAPTVTGGTLRNIISYNAGRYGVNSSVQPSYSDVYGAGTSYNQSSCSTGCLTTNPLNDGTPQSIKYPVRIEEGSPLKGSGAFGADYGANIVKMYGINGSRYGETEYNTLTNTNLWPYPNEDRVKTDMSSSSSRGFCAGDQTLTKYVWEYLGNSIPAEIYGGAANTPPVLASIGNKSVAENSVLTFTVSATDTDGDTLTYSASSLPAGSSFNTSTGVFSWTPGLSQAGSYPGVRFAVTDGSLTDSEDITITVTNTNRLPVLAAIGDKSIAEGAVLTFTLSASDADGDTLTYSATNLPIGASLNASTGVFSWSPVDSQIGSYAVTFNVVDANSASDQEVVSISVILGSEDVEPPYIDEINPDSDEVQVPLDANITFHIKDKNKGVDINTFSLSVRREGDSAPVDIILNGENQLSAYPNSVTIQGTPSDYVISYDPPKTNAYQFRYEQVITVNISANDLAENSMGAYSYSFTTAMMLRGKNLKVGKRK